MLTSVDFISSPSGCMWLLNVDRYREPTQKAFDAKPTERQVRQFKKQVKRSFTPAQVDATRHGLPGGYEMANKDGWGNAYYQTFISIGWTVEQMIEHGYLRRIGAA